MDIIIYLHENVILYMLLNHEKTIFYIKHIFYTERFLNSGSNIGHNQSQAVG